MDRPRVHRIAVNPLPTLSIPTVHGVVLRFFLGVVP